MPKKKSDRRKCLDAMDKLNGRKPKKKQRSMKAIQTELWELCKTLTRRNYPKICFTCGATGLTGQNCHTAHFIPRSTCGAFLKYDLRNLRICCSRCNIWLGGNGAVFYKRMVETRGQEYVDRIFADRSKQINAREHYESLIRDYRNMEANQRA